MRIRICNPDNAINFCAPQHTLHSDPCFVKQVIFESIEFILYTAIVWIDTHETSSLVSEMIFLCAPRYAVTVWYMKNKDEKRE